MASMTRVKTGFGRALDGRTERAGAPGSLDTDVLIVGLGPVGAALANLLGRYGVRVVAIDTATEIFTKPRAIALDNEALRILQLVGVREGGFATVAIPQVAVPLAAVRRVRAHQHAGIVDGHPMLVTFYQPELEHRAALEARAASERRGAARRRARRLQRRRPAVHGSPERRRRRRSRSARPLPGRRRRRELAGAPHCSAWTSRAAPSPRTG